MKALTTVASKNKMLAEPPEKVQIPNANNMRQDTADKTSTTNTTSLKEFKVVLKKKYDPVRAAPANSMDSLHRTRALYSENTM